MKVVITDIDRDITIDLGDKPVDELTLLPDRENTDPDNLPCVYIKGAAIITTAYMGTRWRFEDGKSPIFTTIMINRALAEGIV